MVVNSFSPAPWRTLTSSMTEALPQGVVVIASRSAGAAPCARRRDLDALARVIAGPGLAAHGAGPGVMACSYRVFALVDDAQIDLERSAEDVRVSLADRDDLVEPRELHDAETADELLGFGEGPIERLELVVRED